MVGLLTQLMALPEEVIADCLVTFWEDPAFVPLLLEYLLMKSLNCALCITIGKKKSMNAASRIYVYLDNYTMSCF